ncbi:hypothetical protein BH09DEP1_BH09DEP1_4270 [soil metagenome]
MIKKVLLVIVIFSCAVRSMEQPDSILTCISNANNVEKACEHATELLKKQPTARKITTERFLLACQQKFHHSMFEVGFSMATSESLEIAGELGKEAENLWHETPKNNAFVYYLYERKDIATKIPSYLYYIFCRSAYAKEAKGMYPDQNFITGYLIRKEHHLPYWIDSGLLHDTDRLRQFLETAITDCRDEGVITSVHQIISAGFNLNLKVKRTRISGQNSDQPYLLLDYAMERKTYFETLDS